MGPVIKTTKKNQFSVYLDDDLLLSITSLANAMGMSRNGALVWCLRHCQASMDRITEAARLFEDLPDDVMAQTVDAFGQTGWLLNDELTRILREEHSKREKEKAS